MTEVKLTRVPVSNVVPVVRNPVVNTQYEQDSDYEDDDDYDIDIQTISSSKVVIKRTLKVIMVILFLYIFAAYAYYNYHEDMMVSVLIIFFFIYLVYYFIISRDYIQSKFHILFYYLVNGVMLGYIGVICHLAIEMAWAWQQYNRIKDGEPNTDIKSHDFFHIHRRVNVSRDEEKDVLGVLIAHIVFMIVTMLLFTISFKIMAYGKFVLKDYNIAPENAMDIYEEKESYSILMKEIEKFILLFIIVDIGFPILNFTYNLMMEDLVAGFSIVFAVFHLIYFFNVNPESMKKNEAVNYFLSYLLMCGVGIGYLGYFIYFLIHTIQYIIINQKNVENDDDRKFYSDRYFPAGDWESADSGNSDFSIDYNISLFSYITYGCVMLVYLCCAGYSVLMIKDGWRLFVNRDSINVELIPKTQNNNNSQNNRDENSFNHSLKNIKIEMIITLVFDLFYFIYCFAYKDYDETDLGIIYVVMFVIDAFYLILIYRKYTEEPVYLLFYYLSVICSIGRIITMFYSMKRMREFTEIYVLNSCVGEYKTLAILTGILILVFIVIAFVNWRSVISGLCLWKMTKNHPHGELLGIFPYLFSFCHCCCCCCCCCKKNNNKEEESNNYNNRVNEILESKPIEVELPNVVPVHPEMNENDNNNQPIPVDNNNNNNNNRKISYVKVENKEETKVEQVENHKKSNESKDDSVVVIDNEDEIPDQLELPPELQ